MEASSSVLAPRWKKLPRREFEGGGLMELGSVVVVLVVDFRRWKRVLRRWGLVVEVVEVVVWGGGVVVRLKKGMVCCCWFFCCFDRGVNGKVGKGELGMGEFKNSERIEGGLYIYPFVLSFGAGTLAWDLPIYHVTYLTLPPKNLGFLIPHSEAKGKLPYTDAVTSSFRDTSQHGEPI